MQKKITVKIHEVNFFTYKMFVGLNLAEKSKKSRKKMQKKAQNAEYLIFQ